MNKSELNKKIEDNTSTQITKKPKQNNVKQDVQKKKNEEKKPKEKTSKFKGFFKELKRIRWPKGSEAWRVFGISLIFIFITSLALFLITFTFTNLWTSLGVGIGV